MQEVFDRPSVDQQEETQHLQTEELNEELSCSLKTAQLVAIGTV